MAKQWSENKRKSQREHILKNQPWSLSTGPKTDSGKERSSRNASKGKEPLRAIQKIIRGTYRERLELLKWLEKSYSIKIKY